MSFKNDGVSNTGSPLQEQTFTQRITNLSGDGFGTPSDISGCRVNNGRNLLFGMIGRRETRHLQINADHHPPKFTAIQLQFHDIYKTLFF